MSKIKDEEFEKLKSFLKSIEEEKLKYADIKLRIGEMEEQSSKIYEKLKIIATDYKDYLDKLNSVYGDVRVDFQTGEILDNSDKN